MEHARGVPGDEEVRETWTDLVNPFTVFGALFVIGWVAHLLGWVN